MNNEELEEKKKWFFKENIRLEELRKNLEQQQGKLEKEEQVVEIQKQMLEKQKRSLDLLRKQLDNQKHLFDQQWQILERETRQLAIDREKFKRDKLMYRVKVRIDPKVLADWRDYVKAGLTGNVHLLTEPGVDWPPVLAVRLPPHAGAVPGVVSGAVR